MSLAARLKQRSTLTGLSAILFVVGVTFLFWALFHDATRNGPALWGGLVLLIATVGCWAAAARAEKA